MNFCLLGLVLAGFEPLSLRSQGIRPTTALPQLARRLYLACRLIGNSTLVGSSLAHKYKTRMQMAHTNLHRKKSFIGQKQKLLYQSNMFYENDAIQYAMSF
jgi:hypothetical protein